MESALAPTCPRIFANGPPNAQLPKLIAQQHRIDEKYRYIAELRYEIEQVKNDINSLKKICKYVVL